MTRVRISAGGFQFIAATHPAAPRTAAAFLGLLPYRQKLVHVRWSGEACWIPLGGFQLEVDCENATSHPFLTVAEGREQLPLLGEETLWQGAQDILFELA